MRNELGHDVLTPTHKNHGPAHEPHHGEHHPSLDRHEHEPICDWESAWIDIGGEG